MSKKKNAFPGSKLHRAKPRLRARVRIKWEADTPTKSTNQKKKRGFNTNPFIRRELYNSWTETHPKQLKSLDIFFL